jgi:uncharacterized membrane protein
MSISETHNKKYPLDLIITLLLAILGCATAIVLPEGHIARIIFGIPLLLFCPGYVLVSALWPSNESENLFVNKINIDNLERIALSFGLSLIIVALLGLALNYLSSINLTNTLISNFTFVLIFSGITCYLRQRLPEDKRFIFSISISSLNIPIKKNDKIFVIVIAALLVTAAITAGYMITEPHMDNIYSEFYILDANGTTENYPINMTVNESAQVIVGLVCHEYEQTNYEIIVGLDGANSTVAHSWIQPFNLTQMQKATRSLQLSHLDVFEESFIFYFDKPGTYKITWMLFINGEATEYNTHLWVDVH